MSELIRTEVTLDDGKRVWAYHLDEQERDFFKWLQQIQIPLNNLKWNSDNWTKGFIDGRDAVNHIKALETILKDEIRLYYELTLLDRVTRQTKAFRKYTFIGSFEGSRQFYELIETLFDNAVDDGLIIKGLRGWFRSNVHE